MNESRVFDLTTQASELSTRHLVDDVAMQERSSANSTADLLVQFLCSGTVQLCFHAVSCQKHFLSWTFQLLSVHRCGVEGLFSLLYDVLVMKTGKGSTWVPSVSDIIRVFVNYGATFEDLCPHPHLVSFSKDDLLSTEDKENIEEGQGDHQVAPLGAARTYGIENLQLVIQVISHALTLRPHLYTVNDLMTLTTALLKVALDISLTEGMLAFDFQVCLSAALNAFSADDWSTKAIELCYNLSSLTTHHHNRVHLVAILPPGGRGRYLQRRLAYVMLQQLVFANSRPRDLTDFKVCQLFGVMQALVSQAHTDFYQLSSLLALINQSVGNETLKTAERDDLRQLTDMLRRMIGNVREYIHVLDRTLVKDIMVRLSNKWTFMLRDMGPKQRSLFEWTHHPIGPTPETRRRTGAV
ncbi:SMC5-SMC6 complex localization factor protein 2 [Lamellibrachia satsuma]|nr:SMC5-SMC6 complex localization factor protein 2 [Lamellibrachia satsuma]